jgi:hypothetical protein
MLPRIYLFCGPLFHRCRGNTVVSSQAILKALCARKLFQRFFICSGRRWMIHGWFGGKVRFSRCFPTLYFSPERALDFSASQDMENEDEKTLWSQMQRVFIISRVNAKGIILLFLVCTWRHRRHVGVPLTKDFSLASIVRYTNMPAISLSFYSLRNKWKPRIVSNPPWRIIIIIINFISRGYTFTLNW